MIITDLSATNAVTATEIAMAVETVTATGSDEIGVEIDIEGKSTETKSS
jgi:hypothetical protein